MRNLGKYAQHFHITPEQGLLNDPNGLCYFKGYYHVFYQYNPHGTDHRVKYWGHLRSRDMKHWEQLPVALESNDWFDKNGVYSGGAWVHEETMYLFYTGNTKDENGVRTSYQCVATSTDGITFEKRGPILEQAPGFTGHVRDPKVWYDEEKLGWWLLLGAQREDRTGDTIAYFSKDLMNWDYRGSILQFEQPLGYMWECPDMLFIEDEVTGEEKAVFIFSPQGVEPHGDTYQNIFNTTYLVGIWDNGNAKFIPDHTGVEALVECDRGFEYYAPQSFLNEDGRNVQYAWMGIMWPEVEEAVPTCQDNWIHILSVPRELTLRNGKLIQKPVKEFQTLIQATQQVEWHGDVTLTGPVAIAAKGDTLNTDWQLQVDEEVTIQYVASTRRITVKRTNWLHGKRETRSLNLEQSLTEFLLLLDSSSIEVFINDGLEVFSLRYFAQQPLKKLSFSGNVAEKVYIHSIDGYVFSEFTK